MNIVVINGSPSGIRGVSARYVAYLQRHFPQHTFQVLEVAKKIHRIERDEQRLEAVARAMIDADAIIWCYPVYFMLVSAQLKRLIELLMERLGHDALAGKPCTAISTSAHFYDHTAHDYIAGISTDLGMSFVQGFNAGFKDLLTEQGRRDLLGFARDFFDQAAEPMLPHPGYPPIQWTPPVYDPPQQPAVATTGASKVVIITDAGPEDRSLQQMITVYQRAVAQPVDVLNINQLRMDGGCLGCMRCADDGACGYKDEYAATFDRRVAPADVVLYAGVVRDRYLSARFKVFIDRYFRNGHRPLDKRQLVGFIISGPLQQLGALREILEAHVQMGHNQRLGVATDEAASPETITANLQRLAQATDRWLQSPWFAPPTFLGVGGVKIFRDLVYETKGLMTADHRFYRDHGLYDFPTHNLRNRLFMGLMLALKRIPFLRRRMFKFLLAGKLRRYQQLLDAPAEGSAG